MSGMSLKDVFNYKPFKREPESIPLTELWNTKIDDHFSLGHKVYFILKKGYPHRQFNLQAAEELAASHYSHMESVMKNKQLSILLTWYNTLAMGLAMKIRDPTIHYFAVQRNLLIDGPIFERSSVYHALKINEANNSISLRAVKHLGKDEYLSYLLTATRLATELKDEEKSFLGHFELEPIKLRKEDEAQFDRTSRSDELAIMTKYSTVLSQVSKHLPPWVLARWFQQLRTALSLMHQQQLAHCDIKPDNVALAEDGGVRLIDFGSTVQFDSPIRSSTAAYNPKEINDARQQGERILANAIFDWHMLGIMFIDLLGLDSETFTDRFIEPQQTLPAELGKVLLNAKNRKTPTPSQIRQETLYCLLHLFDDLLGGAGHGILTELAIDPLKFNFSPLKLKSSAASTPEFGSSAALQQPK